MCCQYPDYLSLSSVILVLKLVLVLRLPCNFFLPLLNSCSGFWDKNYPLVKHLNPTFQFMLRAAPEVDPYMMVEYGESLRARAQGWLVGVETRSG